MSAQACTSLTPKTEYRTELKTVKATLLEPSNPRMLEDPERLDLSAIGDDITFPQSIDLNKACIVSHNKLEGDKRDWIAHYRYQRQLNPVEPLGKEEPEKIK